MHYYDYVRDVSPEVMVKVHAAVNKCVNLAKSRYGSRYQDALYDAYHHIVTHFDEAQGDLMHYTARVVSTIYRKHNAREVYSETVLDIESDKVALDECENVGLENIIAWENEAEYNIELGRCIRHLLPSFLKDYELFKTKDRTKRKMNYAGILQQFSVKILWDTLTILSDSYYEDAKYLDELSKNCHCRKFDPDRYKLSMDKTLEYVYRKDKIVNCKSKGLNRNKYAYCIDIPNMLGKICNFFYSEEGVARRVIYGNKVYCSLSGRLVLSKEELLTYLEEEIVGSILAMRTNLKVLHYQKKSELILTSTHEDEPSIVLPMFGAGIAIPMSRLTIGRVAK